jgi:predicted phosphohydrolase
LPRFPALAFLAALAVTPSWSATDITFYAASDQHYGQTGNVGGISKDTARARMIGYLNNLPGTAYPASIGGGTVAPPRAVLIAGDLIEIQDSVQWSQYSADYGVNGEKKLAWPTFESTGNHDFYVTGVIKDTSWVVKKLIARNALRTGLTNKDSTGYHYSWDWDGVHFVNLNLYGGSSELGWNGYRPLYAREFLAQDLAAHVGTSGRPVFIMQHYPLRDETAFPAAARLLFSNVLRDYNVIGILHGHSHNEAVYKWIVAGDTIDAYDDGTSLNGDMMVFQITDGRLRVIARTNNTWSATVLLDKTISMGTPITVKPGQKSPYRNIVFSIPEAGWNQLIPATITRIEITNLQGKRVRLLQARHDRIEWNRRDQSGRRVTPGLYLIRDQDKGTALGKVLLR